MNKKSSNGQLVNGDHRKALVHMAIPHAFGLVSIILFHFVDTIYIAQLGVQPLSAISFTFPVIFTILSLAIGLSVGTTSLVSQSIGKEDFDLAKTRTTYSLFLSFILVFTVSFIGICTIEPVFKFLGATPKLLEYIDDYMSIWYASIAFVVIPIVGNGAIRATGDAKTASMIMLISGISNIILDPLLIFGIGPFPRLEVTGVAIATAISYALTTFVALWVLLKRERLIDVRLLLRRKHLGQIRTILAVSFPAAVARMLTPIANGVLVKVVSHFGPKAVAAFGVATKIESLALIGIYAFSAALNPFVGQNFGAQQFSRIRRAIRYSYHFSFLWTLLIATLLMILSKHVAELFTEDIGVIKNIELYCWIVPITFGFFGVGEMTSSSLYGLGKSHNALMLSVIRLFIVTIPASYIFAQYFDVTGVFAGKALTHISICIFSLWFLPKPCKLFKIQQR